MKPTRHRHSAEPKLKCPECGADLSDSSPGAPCSACLLQLGMNAWQADAGVSAMQPTIASVGVSAGRETLSPDLAAKFPQLEILHLVARGGMGDVYCARQSSLDRLVALKIIRPEAQASPGFADRFIREAQALAKLNHQNIVTVYDFGQTDGVYYFIMEYIDGINLRQMLRSGKLGPRQALEIVPSVCDALQFAHNKGIVHRDIKPENIMVDTYGNVKIADFGLAKLLDQKTATPMLTKANQAMGTMHYMAPEQFERPLDVDHRADIYSLGVVIYELLTGELPLGRFAPPSKKVSVDVRLDEIVLQSLEKEPSLRYQKVSELKSDVHMFSETMASRQNAGAGTAFYPQTAPMPPVKPQAAGIQLPGPIPGGGFRAMLHAQTLRNVLYLLLSFPLGLIYFVLLVVGLSVGLGTAIVWIGAFILLGVFLAVRVMTGLERKLASGLLRTTIPLRNVSVSPSAYEEKTVFSRAIELVTSRESWAGIFYLLAKFPMGIVSFVLTVTLIPVSVALTVSPIVSMFWPLDINFDHQVWVIDKPIEALPFSIVGIVLLFFSVHILNGMAWLHAAWAKLCLKRLPKI